MLHKLYRKHAKANSKESQQAMAVLKAGKLESWKTIVILVKN